jgi:hypothetical protein
MISQRHDQAASQIRPNLEIGVTPERLPYHATCLKKYSAIPIRKPGRDPKTGNIELFQLRDTSLLHGFYVGIWQRVRVPGFREQIIRICRVMDGGTPRTRLALLVIVYPFREAGDLHDDRGLRRFPRHFLLGPGERIIWIFWDISRTSIMAFLASAGCAGCCLVNRIGPALFGAALRAGSRRSGKPSQRRSDLAKSLTIGF